MSSHLFDNDMQRLTSAVVYKKNIFSEWFCWSVHATLNKPTLIHWNLTSTLLTVQTAINLELFSNYRQNTPPQSMYLQRQVRHCTRLVQLCWQHEQYTDQHLQLLLWIFPENKAHSYSVHKEKFKISHFTGWKYNLHFKSENNDN